MRGKAAGRRPVALGFLTRRLVLQGAILAVALIALLLTASRVIFREQTTDPHDVVVPDEQQLIPIVNNADAASKHMHDVEKKPSLVQEGNASIHTLFRISSGITTLEDTLLYLQQQTTCRESPIFVTMAAVGSDIYWQLIENFMYTMERFQLLSCSLMICVSDDYCYKKCTENRFPCYNYHHIPLKPGSSLPSTMEQIAHLKLLHIPKALSKGVDIFTLDLDVGFFGMYSLIGIQ